MTEYTYKDLLDYLGMTNLQFIILSFTILLIWGAVSTYFKLKNMEKVQVHQIIIQEFKTVYISYLGSYDDIGKIYSQCIQDFQSVFKFSNYYVIYYDNPSGKQQKIQSKALIGVVLDVMEQSKVQLFLSKYPMYKICKFPKGRGLIARYSEVSELSSFMAMRMIYPIIDSKLKQLGVTRKYRQIMQVYCINNPKPELNVIVPIDNQEQFQKWYEPTAYSRLQIKKQK